MKKFRFDAWAFFIAVILIVVVLWGLLVHFQRRSEIRNLDPFALVPSDAWLVVDLNETKDITSFFLSDTLAWDELISLEEVARLRGRLSMLDSLSDTNAEFQAAIKNTRVLVSVHTSMRGESPVLLQIRFNPDSGLRQIERMLDALWAQGAGVKEHDFLGNMVYLFKPAEGKPLYASFYKGSLLLSTGRRLIEHTITQDISGSSLVTVAELQDIRTVAGRRANNVFFNGQRLCEVMGLFLSLQPPSLMPCEAFSGWMGWDMALIGDEIRLTGFAQSGKEPGDFLGRFSEQAPSEPFLLEYIPSASAAFAILNSERVSEQGDSIGMFPSIDVEQGEGDTSRQAMLFPFLGQSMASVMLYAPGMSYAEGKLSLIHLSEPEGLWEQMNTPGLWDEQDASLLPIDTVFDRVIWQFIPSGLVNNLTRGMLPEERPFVALQDSVLLAGASPQVVKQALMQIYYGQVVGKEPRLSEDFIFQQPASNLLYMVNIPYLSEMVKPTWKEGIRRLLEQIGEGVYPLDRLTAQFSAHRGGLFFSNVSLHSQGGEASRLHRHLWELRLDTTAHTPPFGMKNHVDGSMEIVVQDVNGTFYLVDRFGKVLWKKPVKGLVNSPVYQVDRYKNGRLQYLFSTPSHLHLIDRNGKDVEGFPKRLSSETQTGISVVDYEADRNYRILFVGDDQRVYNFSVDGRRVGGWLLPELDQPAASAVQYLKLGSRDYLVVVDEGGKPYFFDRRGKRRMNVPEAFRLAPRNPVFTLEQRERKHFVALGPEGTVLQMDENGAVESFVLDSLGPGAGFLLVKPALGKDPVYIFADQEQLRGFDRLGTPLFSQALSGQAALPLQQLRVGQETFIALTAEGQGQLYFFDKTGRLLVPFPLPGEKGLSLVSLLQDQALNVITVREDRLVVYLLGER
jgi:hypothetical protein